MIVSGAAPPTVDVLRRVRRCMSRRPFCRFCYARSRVRKPSTIRGASPDVVIGQSTAARPGARPYQRSLSQDAEIRLLNCSFLLRLCAFCELRRTFLTSGVLRRLCAGPRSTRFRTYGAVGTRSRAIRVSTSDDRVGCSASHGRCAPARPALHVSTPLLSFLPPALASADCIGPVPLLRLL